MSAPQARMALSWSDGKNNMKTYARLHDGVVAELLRTDLDIVGRFNPALIWIDVSLLPGIAEGWLETAAGLVSPTTAIAVGHT